MHEMANLTLRLVSGNAASHLCNEFIARYHYLGYPLRKNFTNILCQ